MAATNLQADNDQMDGPSWTSASYWMTPARLQDEEMHRETTETPPPPLTNSLKVFRSSLRAELHSECGQRRGRTCMERGSAPRGMSPPPPRRGVTPPRDAFLYQQVYASFH